MALQHMHSGQVVDVSPLGPRLAEELSVALFKSSDLEVLRVVLKAGRAMPPHQVPGDVTIHCIEGEFVVSAEGSDHPLRAGELLYLRGGARHDLRALRDSSALVTIALLPPTPA